MGKTLAWAGGQYGYLMLTTNAGGVTKPKAAFDIDMSGLCQTKIIILNSRSQPTYQHYWYKNNRLISTDLNTSYEVQLQRQTDTIMLIVNNGTSKDTSIQTLDAETLKPVSLQSTSWQDTVCQGTDVYFEVKDSKPDIEYSFGLEKRMGNGGTLTFQSSTYNYSDASITYVITAQSSSTCGIQQVSDTHRVFIIDPVPMTNFGQDTVCPQKTFYIRVLNSISNRFYWTNDTSGKVKGNGGEILLPTNGGGNHEGDYSVPVYTRHLSQTCSARPTFLPAQIRLRLPHAAFEASVTEYLIGDTVRLTPDSKAAVSYKWRFPSGGSATVDDAEKPLGVKYSTPGFKKITLVAYSKEGCADSTSNPVQILAGSKTVASSPICQDNSPDTIIDGLREKKYFVPRDFYEDEYGSRVITGGYIDYSAAFHPRGNEKWFALKYNKEGKQLWRLDLQFDGADQYNNFTHQIVEQAASDSLENTYLLGHAFNVMKISIQGQKEHPLPQLCTFLLKVSPEGDIVWVKIFHEKDFANIGSYGPSYASSSILVGANNDLFVVTKRLFTDEAFKVDGTPVLPAYAETGRNGIVFHLDADGKILKQKTFPIKRKPAVNALSSENVSGDNYDPLPHACWDNTGQLVVYGELEPTQSSENNIDGAPVNFDRQRIQSSLFYFDTASLGIISVKPIYKVRAGGNEGVIAESFTIDRSGNYYASHSGEVATPFTKTVWGFPVPYTVAKSYVTSFDNTGSVRWIKQCEGLQPKSMAVAGSQLFVGGTNFPFTGYGGFSRTGYPNQTKTSSTIKKLTAIGDTSSFIVAPSYGLGSLDLMIASFNLSDGTPLKISHFGSAWGEDETVVLKKGFGDQLWFTGTTGMRNNWESYDSLRHYTYYYFGEDSVGSSYDSASTLATYKIPVNNDCAAVYKKRELLLRTCPGADITIISEKTGPSYQWQVNSGNGFINISNNATYSGANTQTLKITNTVTGMAGYGFRCATGTDSYSKQYSIRFHSTWTGTASNQRENPSNWSCGQVPDMNTDVVINGGNTVVSSDAACRSITIKAGAVVKILPAHSLKVTK